MKRKKQQKPDKKTRELHDRIIQELEDRGIDTELLSISIDKVPKIIIEGEVYSHKDKELIYQAIIELTDIDDIEDYTVIMEGIQEGPDLDEDNFENIEDMEDNPYGTEDIYESIEDGEPYIPPVTHKYTEVPKTIRWKKKNKNKAR